MGKHRHGGAARLLAGLAVAALVAPAARAQEGSADFALDAGPAARTVAEFARQANLNVLATTDDLAGVATNAVRGRLRTADALARLLAGTRLVAQARDNGTVVILPAPPPPAAAPAPVPEAVKVEPPKVLVSTRRSQQSSIERKKSAPTAQDSIVDADVGTLPDRNIGEAISRIAGIAINRGEFDEGTSFSIRGNGSELTRVELDGQAVRSAGGSDMNGGGDGRATEFRQLSAALIKSVDVVKGATAAMTEGSLGGSILIRTRSSLDFPTSYVALRAAGSRNSLNHRWDPDVNGIFTRRFLDGRLGVLLNVTATRLTNESHQTQVSSNGRDGAMRAIDFDASPEKTFAYLPATLDLGDPSTTRPWATYGTWNAATPYDIVAKSAAAQSKAECYAAFPVLNTGSGVLTGLGATNKLNAINARNQELASCLNQWNDTNPALLRYFVKRQVDDRQNLDLRTDFRVDRRLALYAKGSFSRRTVDDNALSYSLGNVAVNPDPGKYTDSAQGVRTAVAGTGYATFPDAYSLASGKPPLQGAVANIDPASVVVDANHHVTRYTLSNAAVFNDQIRNRMGTNTRYLQVGGAYRDHGLAAEFLVGDMRSQFWRGDLRTAWGYNYGAATVALQPNGIWAYTVPSGTDLNDWTRVAALQPAASGTAPQYTANAPQITFSPQLRATAERTARLDLKYALPEALPLLRRLHAGLNLRDTGSDAWAGGGYTVTPAAGAAPAVTVPGNNVRGSFTGCQPTATAPCTYGVLPVAGTRSYQIVLTPLQFQQAVSGALRDPATATRLFDGARGRPDALIDNWTQIDVERLFATIGAPNLDFDCMKTCRGSDGKTYEQPKTSLRERTLAAYVMADFDLDGLPFGWQLEGNAGWRAVRTRVAGTGILTFVSKLKTARFDPANPGAAPGYTTSQLTRNTQVAGVTHDFLPIFNLALWVLPDEAVVRYSHAKAVARPGVSKLVPSGTCTYDETLLDANGAPLAAMSCTTVGNPELRAQANVNQNLAVEWYPNRDTTLGVAAYRQVGHVGAPQADSLQGVKLFAGSDVVDPASGRALGDIPFDLRSWINGAPATRTGVEFSARTAFTFLPWRLRYLGFDANVTRQHSNQERAAVDLLSGAVLGPVGEPKYSFNWALWYDDGAWQARIAVQAVGSKFSCIAPCGDSLSGYALNAYPNPGGAARNPAYNPGAPNIIDRTSYVDGKIAWRMNRHLDFFVEGRNLTNQTQTTSIASSPYADGTPNLQNYYYAGRRITVGANYHY